MNDLDPFEDDEGSTVFRDVIMLALLGFVAIVVLLLPHLNPPVRADESAAPPGNVIVEVRWPDGRLERLEALTAGRYHRLVRGAGQTR